MTAVVLGVSMAFARIIPRIVPEECQDFSLTDGSARYCLHEYDTSHDGVMLDEVVQANEKCFKNSRPITGDNMLVYILRSGQGSKLCSKISSNDEDELCLLTKESTNQVVWANRNEASTYDIDLSKNTWTHNLLDDYGNVGEPDFVWFTAKPCDINACIDLKPESVVSTSKRLFIVCNENRPPVPPNPPPSSSEDSMKLDTTTIAISASVVIVMFGIMFLACFIKDNKARSIVSILKAMAELVGSIRGGKNNTIIVATPSALPDTATRQVL